MGSSLAADRRSMESNSLDTVEPRMAKASLDGQSRSIGLTEVVKDALIRHYGSLKAAALSMQMDQGQLTRELQSGDFKMRRLESDAHLATELGKELVERFGPLSTPKARGKQKLREMRAAIEELDQLLEQVS